MYYRQFSFIFPVHLLLISRRCEHQCNDNEVATGNVFIHVASDASDICRQSVAPAVAPAVLGRCDRICVDRNYTLHVPASMYNSLLTSFLACSDAHSDPQDFRR